MRAFHVVRNLAVSVLLTIGVGLGQAQAKDALLSMAYTNALGEELPFSIFSKKSWAPDPKARFVKLHLYFDQPITVKGMELDDCGSKLKNDLSVFFNFDQWVLRLDPKLDGEIPPVLKLKRTGQVLAVEGFREAVEVRSLTINFERNAGFKICDLRLKDPQGQPYTIKIPALVAGQALATSTLHPRTAYDPVFLFDSRFEYGWASNKQARNVALDFSFEQTKRIEQFRIWNGYQRSVTHCYANSRAKTIRITGDNGYQETVQIKDVLGSQLIRLPKPFEGKELKFEIVDAFLGKSYQDLVISEIRFFDGKEWFMLDPSAKLKADIEVNRASFANAKAGVLLNDSYGAITETDEEVKAAGARIASTLRLRSDGSFYLSGSSEGGESWFALGNYEIKNADPAKGMRLRLFGLLHLTEVYGDCNGCGRDCNKNSDSEEGVTQTIFQETIVLKPLKDGRVDISTESGGKKLFFKRLVFSRED